MPVKKITATPIKALPKVISPPKPAVEYQLPTEMKEPDLNFSHYLILIYGQEKIGKTTLLKDFPDCLFFTTEPGTKGLRIFEFNSERGGITDWAIFRKGVDLLVKTPGKFQTVAIDTVDRAYDMCLDWVCKDLGIDYPGQDASGEEDFGKSWKAVTMEFLEQIHRITHSGRGVVFTSHAKTEVIKNKDTGDKYTRIEPTMSKGAKKVVHAIVDFFFYAEYFRDMKGQVQRILVCEGDEMIWAGAREGVVSNFPRFLPLLQKGGYTILKDAFLGKYPGLDPRTMMPSRSTSKPGAEFLGKAKLKAVRATAKPE